MLTLMLITGRAEVAAHAVACGVDRIFVDMESRGKAERQKRWSTHLAAHTLEDVEAVRAALTAGELLVRVNPRYEGTPGEIEEVLARGADRIMLPMFRACSEAAELIERVAGRAAVTLLVETPQALARAVDLVELLSERDEVYFGLNDLSLGLGLDFLFEPLAGRLLDGPAGALVRRGVRFGFGGIGRMGGSHDLVPAELVLSEHVRLGSSAVILSRAFHGGARSLAELEEQLDLRQEVARLREAESALVASDPEALERNADELARRVFGHVRSLPHA